MKQMDEWGTITETGQEGTFTVKLNGGFSKQWMSVFPEFRDRMLDIAGPERTVYFNFDGLEQLETSDVQILLALGRELEAQGGHLALRGVSQSLEDLLTLSGLSMHLPIAFADTGEGRSWGLF